MTTVAEATARDTTMQAAVTAQPDVQDGPASAPSAEIRIGTVEIVAAPASTQEPPSGPRLRGFAAYLTLRSYVPFTGGRF